MRRSIWQRCSPDDLPGIVAARAIVTARGGLASHAAAVARGLGRPCVVGAADLTIDLETRTITTAIALETSKGEFAQGIALGLLLIAIALVINAALLLLQGEARNSGVIAQ